MSSPRIALIHATPVAIEPIVDAFRHLWSEARITNLLEDSLPADLAADGRLTENMVARFMTLARYAYDHGANAILFTCSAFGPAIEAARAALPIPVLKPNEAMLEEALAAGTRLGLIATFEPSIGSLETELRQQAKEKNMAIAISARAVPAALVALHAGKTYEHNRLIAAAAEEIGDCDALILAQFSMASAAAVINPQGGRKVLTSPASAVLRLRQLLSA